MHKDLGQRSDQEGGKREIVFIGFSKSNPHYIEAKEEERNGYWDKVHFLHPRDNLDREYFTTNDNTLIRAY